MAWIRTRTRRDGGQTYYVQWREHGQGPIQSISIRDDKSKAENTVRLLDANDQSYELAETAHARAKIGGETVADCGTTSQGG